MRTGKIGSSPSGIFCFAWVKKKCRTSISVLTVQYTTENLAKGRIKIPGLQWSCIMSPCRQIIACKRLKQLGQTLGRPWEENPAIHYVLEVETYCRCCAAERGRDVNLGWMCISWNPHLVTLLWPGMVVYLLVARVLQWHYDFLFTLKYRNKTQRQSEEPHLPQTRVWFALLQVNTSILLLCNHLLLQSGSPGFCWSLKSIH